ncbi:MAG TPA: citrate/2-methylcitrate synthase [Candidatus Limnocylindrales bacterium]|nr:citrate/2-methylcitrate synthase [Candidatus Limnocylindrales bacterium]
MAPSKAGLEDVVAANSAICEIIGPQGTLTYRGIDIHDLARHSSFEEVTYLLWFGHLPSEPQLRQFAADLRARRALPDDVVGLLRRFPRQARPMDVLRTGVSALGLYEATAGGSPPASLEQALRVTARMPTLVATFEQIRRGRDPVAPTADGSHAESFLRMLFAAEPEPLAVRAMDLALILHADHELNASTFAARVTAATLADIDAAVVAAIGALSGPLHGGANEQVMKMLQKIAEPDRAPAVVAELLAAHRKIPGFGHRVYRTEDPRVVHLREMSRQLGQQTGNLRWYEISRRVEEAVMDRKHLYPNVDFYAASCYFSIGIPVDMFTPVFAVSRISGWAAHVLEQYADNRLIRPRAEYVGERDVPYTPIAQRVLAVG